MRQGHCLQNINGAHCTETKRDGRVVNVQLHVVHLTDTEDSATERDTVSTMDLEKVNSETGNYRHHLLHLVSFLIDIVAHHSQETPSSWKAPHFTIYIKWQLSVQESK